MYVTSSILVLEATCIKTKVAVASTFYVGSFSKHAEETVDGKRLKCDRPLRRSIFLVFHHYYFFLLGWGGGGGAEWGSLNEILTCDPSKANC